MIHEVSLYASTLLKQQIDFGNSAQSDKWMGLLTTVELDMAQQEAAWVFPYHAPGF